MKTSVEGGKFRTRAGHSRVIIFAAGNKFRTPAGHARAIIFAEGNKVVPVQDMPGQSFSQAKCWINPLVKGLRYNDLSRFVAQVKTNGYGNNKSGCNQIIPEYRFFPGS